jgi:hypothetical protein
MPTQWLYLAAVVALSAVGCQGDPEHPPVLNLCGGDAQVGCGSPAPRSGAAPTDAGTQPGGDAGQVRGGASAATLTGRVLVFADDQFSSASPFFGTVDVSANAAGGGRVRTGFDGASDAATGFTLENVAVSPTNFLAAEPVGLTDVLTTIQPVATDSVTQIDVTMVPASSLDFINSVISNPTLRAQDRGQALIFVRDRATGAPLSGVRISNTNSEFIANLMDGTWSDFDEPTGPAGLALAGNIQAAPLPGIPATFLFESAGSTASIPIQVANNAVTVMEVRL